MAIVTLYGKPGCHLCEEARTVVATALAGRRVELREVDVSLDPALERAYGERIPVVAVDGEDRFQYFVDGEELAGMIDGLERSTGE